MSTKVSYLKIASAMGLHTWAVDGWVGDQAGNGVMAIPCYKCSLPSGLHGAEHIPRMRRG